jgi:hypothetical protein
MDEKEKQGPGSFEARPPEGWFVLAFNFNLTNSKNRI